MRDCPKSFGSTGQSFCATLSCHCSWLRTFRLDQRSVQRSVALSQDLRRPSRHYAGVRDRSLRRRTASPVAACRQARRGVEGRIGYRGRQLAHSRASGEGPLTEPPPATQPGPRGLVFMLRVFGRLPVTDSATRSEAGVRKASGEETAREFAPAVVSVYGDLASDVDPDPPVSNRGDS
jgi:hypothetical protein